MAFGARLQGGQARALRDLLGSRGCPLCGETGWDFERAQLVFLVNARDQDNVRRRLRMTGGGFDEASVARKVLEEAARDPLIRVACDNCGHTELLDARKIRA